MDMPNAPEMFYVSTHPDETRGPYTREQIQSMWDSGQLAGNTRYWNDDAQKWQPLYHLIASWSAASLAPPVSALAPAPKKPAEPPPLPVPPLPQPNPVIAARTSTGMRATLQPGSTKSRPGFLNRPLSFFCTLGWTFLIVAVLAMGLGALIYFVSLSSAPQASAGGVTPQPGGQAGSLNSPTVRLGSTSTAVATPAPVVSTPRPIPGPFASLWIPTSPGIATAAGDVHWEGVKRSATRANEKYPETLDGRSAISIAIKKEMDHLDRTNLSFYDDRSWPERLADQCAGQIGYQPSPGAGVDMVREDGILKVPVQLNGVISLKFVVDSGASDVQIPKDVFLTLFRAETIKESDYLPGQIFVLADGSKVPSSRFKLHSMKVGSSTVTDVPASVGNTNGALLLGQSFLSRFNQVRIDNQKAKLILTK